MYQHIRTTMTVKEIIVTRTTLTPTQPTITTMTMWMTRFIDSWQKLPPQVVHLAAIDSWRGAMKLVMAAVKLRTSSGR